MIDRFKGEYDWLSNFYPCPVRLDGLEFPSVEAAYQAHKILSPDIRERIRALPTAADAKRFGKRIGRVIPYRPAWSDPFRIHLMRHLLWRKFSDPTLRQRLIATGDEILVEGGHWHDVFWGQCNCRNCGGKGANWLGLLLMEIRTECQAKDTSMTVAENWSLQDAA